MTFARDGSGSRPLAVTIAGWGLIADAAISMVAILVGVLDAGSPLALTFVVVLLFEAIAILEIWIGRGLLQRRRWLLGIAFPGFFLALGLLVPTLPDAPPPPAFSVIYGSIAMVVWAFVVVALVWHRPWFDATEESIHDRFHHNRR